MVCLHSFVTLSTTGRQFIEFVLGIKLLAKSLIEASSSLLQILEKTFYSRSLKFLTQLFGDLETFLGSIAMLTRDRQKEKERFRTETI